MRRRFRLRQYILMVILIALAGGYLAAHVASVAIPPMVHTALVTEFERSTGKKVLLRSLRFNIFRGISLDKVVIYDRTHVIARAKTVSAKIIFADLIRKKIVIPFMRIESPSILVERREDGTFNLADLIPRTFAPSGDVSVVLRRIVIKHGRAWFVDRGPEPDYKTLVENVNADIRLTFPARITCRAQFDIPGKPPTSIEASGEYLIPQETLQATVKASSIAPSLLAGYLPDGKCPVTGGRIDGGAFLTATKESVTVAIDARADGLILAVDKARAESDAVIQATAVYRCADRSLEWSGQAELSAMSLDGIEGLGALRGISGRLAFDRNRLWSESLECTALGIPWKARINLVNYANPILDIYASAETKLGAFQKTLCETCSLRLPVDVAGDAAIDIAMSFEKGRPPRMNGYLRFTDATIRLGNGRYPVEHVTGEAHIEPQRLTWSEVRLSYRDTAYTVKGVLTNFDSPGVVLDASSKDLAFTSSFNMSGPVITLTELKGRYLHSTFSVTGTLDIADQTNIVTDVRGSVDLHLKDVRAAGSRSPGVRKMKPAGRILAEFALAGGMKDLACCALHAKVKSPYLSVYGARMSDVALDYLQERGVGQVKSLNARCYGGVLKATAKIDYRSRAQPFSLVVDAQDIMLERLKADTGFRGADVSGDLKVYANLNGYFKDFSRLSGLGRITIVDGKLWELNLFKGIGTAIFTSDFKNVIFSEGSCDFKIADQNFYADSLELKGELLRLSGLGRLGFDKSVEVLMRPQITDEAMDLATDTQRGIAIAVQDGTEIEITGSLQHPAFKMHTDAATVIGGVAGALLAPGSQ